MVNHYSGSWLVGSKTHGGIESKTERRGVYIGNVSSWGIMLCCTVVRLFSFVL